MCELVSFILATWFSLHYNKIIRLGVKLASLKTSYFNTHKNKCFRNTFCASGVQHCTRYIIVQSLKIWSRIWPPQSACCCYFVKDPITCTVLNFSKLLWSITNLPADKYVDTRIMLSLLRLNSNWTSILPTTLIYIILCLIIQHFEPPIIMTSIRNFV